MQWARGRMPSTSMEPCPMFLLRGNTCWLVFSSGMLIITMSVLSIYLVFNQDNFVIIIIVVIKNGYHQYYRYHCYCYSFNFPQGVINPQEFTLGGGIHFHATLDLIFLGIFILIYGPS